ncbi:MAG: adenosine kinase [Sphingomonadaceae bacterium]|nr:MAG: adenosine kinase [Sphingomonadaceae bacterium]
MSDTRFDILAMGDAMVDVIAPASEEFLAEHNLPRGSMQLLSPEAADKLYDAMGVAEEHSGGSAANTVAGVAAMGGKVAFIGQVADDQFGRIFRHDLQALGVHFDTPPIPGPPPTGRCLILVTPDGQRTMNTAPGASHELVAAQLDPQLIRDSAVLYLEGYLFGPAKPRDAMMEAINIAHGAKRKVAFTLSESVCIAERRDPFIDMIKGGGVDLLFCNGEEARVLTGAQSADAAMAQLSDHVPLMVVTDGPNGAMAATSEETVRIDAVPVDKVVDTTGAGDLFAAGFLFAHCRGAGLGKSLETGAIAAAEVISHFGARPEADLKELITL